MGKPYLHMGTKRLAAALLLAGFNNTEQLVPSGPNTHSYGTEVRTLLGIAQGESSGDAYIVSENKNDSGIVTSTDYGVLQVNDLYEGDLLIKTTSKYAGWTDKQLRDKFGTDRRNTFYAYLRYTNRSWQSYIDSAVMARAEYKYGGKGFYSWIAFWDPYRKFSALDDTGRVNWGSIDRGLADLKTELDLGYSLERIASIFLDNLTADPRKPLTR